MRGTVAAPTATLMLPISRRAAQPRTPMAMRVPSACVDEHTAPPEVVYDEHTVRVVFFDNRPTPDVEAMRQAARLVRRASRTPVEFHALLQRGATRGVHNLWGLRVHDIVLPPFARCLHTYLSASSHGPGTQYLYKVFVPWMLPWSVPKALLLDTDVATIGDVRELWSSFDRFGGALLGLANEQNDLYKPLVGLNGGVQLLDLHGLKSSREYTDAIRSFNVHGFRIGYLGDQTFYTVMAHVHPHLFHRVGCQWNRQMNTHFGIDHFRPCRAGCALLHANQGPVKHIVQFLQRHTDATCSQWHRFIREGTNSTTHARLHGALRTHFWSCCTGHRISFER